MSAEIFSKVRTSFQIFYRNLTCRKDLTGVRLAITKVWGETSLADFSLRSPCLGPYGGLGQTAEWVEGVILATGSWTAFHHVVCLLKTRPRSYYLTTFLRLANGYSQGPVALLRPSLFSLPARTGETAHMAPRPLPPVGLVGRPSPPLPLRPVRDRTSGPSSVSRSPDRSVQL